MDNKCECQGRTYSTNDRPRQPQHFYRDIYLNPFQLFKTVCSICLSPIKKNIWTVTHLLVATSVSAFTHCGEKQRASLDAAAFQPDQNSVMQ